MKLPQGPPHNKVEALVQGIRHARTCLRAVNAENDLFTSFFTVGTLVDKLAEAMQSRWFYYQTDHPDEEDHMHFMRWMEVEGKAAMKQGLTVLVAVYQKG